MAATSRDVRPKVPKTGHAPTGPDSRAFDREWLRVTPVRLTPHEQERLMVSLAAMVARDRRARGVRLNQPEAVSLIASYVLEGARDGRAVSDLAAAGRHVVRRDEVMDGVPEMLSEVQVEATFPDGTKLVTVHDPIQ